MVMLSGMTAPAPSPWIARKTISCVIVPATPESAEPARNTATPRRYMRRRP
jgi:hypothetical protein